MKRDQLLEFLDWDPRVLGIEVIENGRNSEKYWDFALSTGRQCFGFFVPDWEFTTDPKAVVGVNVLCVREHTSEACLKAYREGNFYGAEHGLDELAFTSISFDGRTVKATTDKSAVLQLITAKGVVKEVKGTSLEWIVKPGSVFARVKAIAADGCGEKLYSQPFMLDEI